MHQNFYIILKDNNVKIQKIKFFHVIIRRALINFYKFIKVLIYLFKNFINFYNKQNKDI